MFILYITQTFIGPDQPGSLRHYEIARRLVTKGHRVLVLTGSTAGYNGVDLTKGSLSLCYREDVEGVEVLRVKIPFARGWSIARRIYTYLYFAFVAALMALVGPKPDIVYASSTPLTVAVPALALKLFRGVDFVFEVRDLWPEFAVAYGVLRNPLIIWPSQQLEALTYRYSRHVVALTAWMRDRLRARGIPEEKVSVVYNGVDVETFCPEGPCEDLRTRYSMPSDAWICMFVGSHTMTCNLPWVLDLASHFGSDSRVYFVLIGDGYVKQALMDQAKRAGLRNVVFLPAVPKAEVPRYLRAANLCIVPDLPLRISSACVPNKLFDYLALGKPVLINYPGEAAAMLSSTRAGFYVPQDKFEEVKATILKVLDDSNTVREMGGNARRLAAQEFSWTIVANQVDRIIISSYSGTSGKP